MIYGVYMKRPSWEFSVYPLLSGVSQSPVSVLGRREGRATPNDGWDSLGVLEILTGWTGLGGVSKSSSFLGDPPPDPRFSRFARRAVTGRAYHCSALEILTGWTGLGGVSKSSSFLGDPPPDPRFLASLARCHW
jgi:hypothetical protein